MGYDGDLVREDVRPPRPSAICYHRGVACALPPDVARLFWDTEPDSVDLHVHRDYVMERVMSRGGWTAMCWLRDAYSPPQLAEFLVRKGMRLAPRERAYWSIIAGIELSLSRGGARPPWAGQ